MSTALARYLKDFGEPPVPHASPEPLPDFSSEAPALSGDFDFSDDLPAAGPDLDSLREEAYAEGYETASVELSTRHAEQMAALQENHEAEMAALREAYEHQAATRIAEGLRALGEMISLRISEDVAHCLAPVLQEEIARKSVEAMAVLVREAIRDGDVGQIIVKGPLSLFNILATEMGEDAAMLRYIEAADLDLTVEQGGSVLVTRLSAFAASLKKVLE